MKLKEIPISIYTSLKLSKLSNEVLKNKTKDEIPVIVSLTSIPTRLPTLHLTIKSILNQEVRPKAIILWLHHSLENKIPKKLERLEDDLFHIKYSDLTCSHRKLIHTIELYPNDNIITCDDDMMYHPNWLRLLYLEHLEHPKSIIGNQTRYIQYSKTGEVLPYKEWVYTNENSFNPNAVIAIGAEGILYPPYVLSDKTTDSDLFLKLTPKADDLWFKGMAILKGTIVISAKKRAKTPIPIIGSQKKSLKKQNISGDENRNQWVALTEYFNIETEIFL
ncbi:glycosyltransferase family A protein [Maribacter sp. X9]|uniref:glycosyltransferase family A protein n=1 Tax=Maribacter sp. X9 TaxID=3402159 RepID=UPI003AF366CD